MLRSAIPTRFQLPWAKNAGGSFIRTVPVASQIGINAGAASYNDGFVPDNFTQIAAGGVPPFGQDMNGVLNETTVWDQWYQAGGSISFDSAFATAIGGYPQGAVLMSAVVLGNYWMSTADNNTTDPDSSGAANWINPPGFLGTGALGYTAFTTMPTGWVWARNGFSIGSAASGSSYGAADAVFLFSAIWNGFPNSQCPIFTSGGVATTRGANAAADFAANKQLFVLDMGGTGIIGQDNASGRLTSVPVISGNANAPGALIGENLHTLVAAELASHTHNVSGSTGGESNAHTHAETTFLFSSGQTAASSGGAGFTGSPTAASTGQESTGHSHGVALTTDGGTGGNGAHNTVQRSMTVNWMLKL